MNRIELQQRLAATGRYSGPIDDDYGKGTRAGVRLALTDGPDTKLTEADFAASALRLGVKTSRVKAVNEVEAAGGGFEGGRPIILFEPHRFSRATKHRFDKIHDDVSYENWDRKRYPRTQDARYDQLVKAVGLDVNAGFASASYGRFQILGENFAQCGYRTPFDFAVAQAHDEATQLQAFERFVVSKGLLAALRDGNWGRFATGYNGSAYRENKYDERLAAADRKFS